MRTSEMSSFMLLIWISLIVVLNVRAESSSNDNLINNQSSICQHCNSNTLPDCAENESLNRNLTIHCSQSEPMPCVIAVVEAAESSNATDFMCFLNEPIEITKNVIQTEKSENILEEQESVVTSVLPSENASVEEIKNENAVEPNAEVTVIEPMEEKQITEAPREEVASTVSGDIENTLIGDAEPRAVENADEMPQADQPLPEPEANEKEITEIEDNKIEATVASNDVPTVTSKPVEDNIEAEPRINIVEENTEAVPKLEMLNCYGCQSEMDSNCIAKPTKTVSCKTAEIGTNGCYTLLKDIHIARGCLDELPNYHAKDCLNASEKTCQVCHENFCNNGIFPAERQFCHQCTSTADCALEQLLSNALPCPHYEQEDACFLHADDYGNMQRGCKSSRELYERCLAFGDERCLTCTGQAGCNSQPLLLKPKLACSACDSRSAGEQNAKNCAWTQPTNSVSSCQNAYPYYLKEHCVMVFLPDVEISVRGCALDIGTCEPLSPWCSSCDTNGCNVKNLVIKRCLQCNSYENSNCSFDVKEFTAEKCKANIQTFENRGCFVSWSSDTNITSRGCISDLTAEGIDYCKAQKKLCVFCHENGCNNLLAPSSAESKALINYGLILFAIFYSY